MRLDYSAIALLLGLVYAVIYFFLALTASGAGHGTFVFMIPFCPFPFGLAYFLSIAIFAANLSSFISKLIFVAVMVVHYTLVVNIARVSWMGDRLYLLKTWNYSPIGVVLPAGFYLSGQLLLWALFVRSFRNGGELIE